MYRSGSERGERTVEARLSIGELAERTGVGVSTLRAWETRYRFPVPQRLESGHRRYDERDVEAVRSVLRERRSGSSLAAAIRRARSSGDPSAPLALSTLRQALADVAPAALSKRTLQALSQAIEDEAAVRARQPVLVGCFQHARFWEASRARWQDLARTSSATVAVAVGATAATDARLWQVPLAPSHPLTRDWVVVCDSPTFSAVLVGREPPGGRLAGPAAERYFESLWSVEPAAVREVARVVAGVAADAVPELADPVQRMLRGPAYATYDTVRAATALTNRIVAYLDRNRTG